MENYFKMNGVYICPICRNKNDGSYQDFLNNHMDHLDQFKDETKKKIYMNLSTSTPMGQSIMPSGDKYYGMKYHGILYYVCPTCATAETSSYEDFIHKHSIYLGIFKSIKKLDIIKSAMNSTEPVPSTSTNIFDNSMNRKRSGSPNAGNNKKNNKTQRKRTEAKHAMNRRVQEYTVEPETDTAEARNIDQFMKNSKSEITGILEDALQRLNAIKVNFFLEAIYTNVDGEIAKRAFKTSIKSVLMDTDIPAFIQAEGNKIIHEADENESKKSGWTLERITRINIRINKYSPMRGSSYIPLPEWVELTKSCVNVKNFNDDLCFKYSILSKILIDEYNDANPYRANKYNNIQHLFDFSTIIKFPPSMHEIKKFENANNLSINIFGIEHRHVV